MHLVSFRPGDRLQPALMVLALLLSAPALAQTGASSPSPEYSVKAVFLYNFTRFVEWPTAPVDCTARPLTIAVLGDDPFGPTLDRVVATRSAGGPPYRIQRLRSAAQVEPCTLLFVAAPQSRRLAEILAELRGKPVLVVGETPEFARKGGAIGFYLENRKVRFEANVHAAAAAGLRLSSRLLAVTSVVDGDKAERSDR